MTKFLAVAMSAAVLAAGSAHAQTKIQIGCNACMGLTPPGPVNVTVVAQPTLIEVYAGGVLTQEQSTSVAASGGNLFLHSSLNIDNMAHLGGFTCGLLFAAPMVPRLGAPRRLFQLRLRLAVVIVVGVLVLFGFYLSQLPPRG